MTGEARSRDGRRGRAARLASGIGLLLVLAVPTAMVVAFAGRFIGGGNDYGAFLFASRRVLAGLPLYSTEAYAAIGPNPLSHVPPWRYPPIYVLIFLPFAPLPFQFGLIVWTTASVLFLWRALVALARELGYRPARRGLLLSWLAVLTYLPVLRGAGLGQTTPAMVGAFTVGIIVHLRTAGGARDAPPSDGGDTSPQSDQTGGERGAMDLGRDGVWSFASGTLTAVTVLVKPYYAPAAADTIHDHRRFAGLLAGCLAVPALSLLVFGPDTFGSYVDVLEHGRGWGFDVDFKRWWPSWYEPFWLAGRSQHVVRAAVGVVTVGTVVTAGAVTHLVERRPSVVRGTAALGLVSVGLLTPDPKTLELIGFLPAALLLSRDTDPRILVGALALASIQVFYPPLAVWALPQTPTPIFGVAASPPGLTALTEGSTAFYRAILVITQPGLWANLVLWVLSVRTVVGGIDGAELHRALRRIPTT